MNEQEFHELLEGTTPEKQATAQLVRPPQPDREMIHRGSPADAEEHQRRTWVRNQDSQLADAYHTRKQSLVHKRLLTEKARDHASLEETKYTQLATETEQALARWNLFRRSNADVLPEPS